MQVRLDLAGKLQQIEALHQKASDPELWADQQSAQAIMQQLTRLQEQVAPWLSIGKRIDDLLELLDLSESEDDHSMVDEAAEEVEAIRSELDSLEFQLLLGGPYDDRNAILAIHAGAGGTESQDWAEMLMRMYLRWAEGRHFKTEILDLSPGDEAGIKSVTIELAGPFAYGRAKAERGVHRLVRLSPFDAAHRRHTSFALVEVLPEVEDSVEAVINENDLRIDTYRSTGAGGQHVNKTDSAVRITHLPTGIVVTCQNERSQMQNREVAMKILRARLLEVEQRRQEEEQARLKGEHVAAGWGNQIRSYVLHPYNMVKDHRTGYETSNTAAVLNGDLDAFIEEYLKSQVGKAE
ncbi:MAG: peptide chain release factor 2 [Chloroflexi bacterium]|nr:peptide chain release factor 2 [Chloroflexota bacterium]